MPDGDDFAARYRLLRELGSGGMGTVWLARDEMLHREVAIKELKLPPEMNEAERAETLGRAVREAQTTAQLRHPNVVAIHDVRVHDGKPWIVMELLRGRSLADFVAEHGPVAPHHVATMGVQLLDGLTAAHLLGIQHRDVKPGNAFLTESGRVVLTDFGIAKLSGENPLTQTGLLVGSPGFIAPERLDGEPGGPASDLWSLGATLYFAVEGVKAFTGETMAILAQTLSGRIRPPQRAGPLTPVLPAMMARHPGDRPDPATVRRWLTQVAGGRYPDMSAGPQGGGRGRMPYAPPQPGPHAGPHSDPHAGPHSGPHAGPHSDPHAGPHSDPRSEPRPGTPEEPPTPPVAAPPGPPPGPPPAGTPTPALPYPPGPSEAPVVPPLPDTVPARPRSRARLWLAVAAAVCLGAVAGAAALTLRGGADEERAFTLPVDFCTLLTDRQLVEIGGGVKLPGTGRKVRNGCAWETAGLGIALIPHTDSDTPQPWALSTEDARELFAALRDKHAREHDASLSWKEIGLGNVSGTARGRQAVPDVGEEAFRYEMVSPQGHVYHVSVYARVANLVIEAQYATLSFRPTDEQLRESATKAARYAVAALRSKR